MNEYGKIEFLIEEYPCQNAYMEAIIDMDTKSIESLIQAEVKTFKPKPHKNTNISGKIQLG